MQGPSALVLRIAALLLGALLLAVGGWLGYVSVVAFRRSEGVFMPAGYVSLLCLAGAALLLRVAWRG
jgi:hypothetical protein